MSKNSAPEASCLRMTVNNKQCSRTGRHQVLALMKRMWRIAGTQDGYALTLHKEYSPQAEEALCPAHLAGIVWLRPCQPRCRVPAGRCLAPCLNSHRLSEWNRVLQKVLLEACKVLNVLKGNGVQIFACPNQPSPPLLCATSIDAGSHPAHTGTSHYLLGMLDFDITYVPGRELPGALMPVLVPALNNSAQINDPSQGKLMSHAQVFSCRQCW